MIGVLGGTFDPVHYGHLRPGEEAYRRLGLARLQVVPVARPPHRPAPLASAAERLRMVELALAEFPGFIADDREVRRGGVSYTVPTLEDLRREIGPQPLCLLLGADAYAGLPAWHRWERLFDLAHIVVLQRPGALLSRDEPPAWARDRLCAHASDLDDRLAGGILYLPVTPHDASATRLRAMIARGEPPPPDQLPPAVWGYIRQHQLYRGAA